MTTVAGVLFGPADPATALAAVPAWRAVMDGVGRGLTAVSAGGRALVEQELARASAGLLSLDLGGVLVAAWRRHRALISAALATQDDPAASEVVQLATHRVTSTHRPYVTVAVSGAQIATVRFELSLTVEVDGVLATVARAHLVALRGGRCLVTASLGFEGQPLVSRQAVLDPVVTVPLGSGLALLPERAPAPTESPRSLA